MRILWLPLVDATGGDIHEGHLHFESGEDWLRGGVLCSMMLQAKGRCVLSYPILSYPTYARRENLWRLESAFISLPNTLESVQGACEA